eukprot:1949858-Rhodomonas_salina.1
MGGCGPDGAPDAARGRGAPALHHLVLRRHQHSPPRAAQTPVRHDRLSPVRRPEEAADGRCGGVQGRQQPAGMRVVQPGARALARSQGPRSGLGNLRGELRSRPVRRRWVLTRIWLCVGDWRDRAGADEHDPVQGSAAQCYAAGAPALRCESGCNRTRPPDRLDQGCGGGVRGDDGGVRAQEVARTYARSQHPLMLRYDTKAMGRGCSIKYLSVFPKEDEYLYPPLTYLSPIRKFEDDDGVQVRVLRRRTCLCSFWY